MWRRCLLQRRWRSRYFQHRGHQRSGKHWGCELRRGSGREGEKIYFIPVKIRPSEERAAEPTVWSVNARAGGILSAKENNSLSLPLIHRTGVTLE